ncbi:hypothetical protein HanIR_Chr02g0059271 [Helianthus annuus]|nr:hypothetical protein HanIR_Chr02g0059271 [Helianthus annuus]
MIRHYDMEGTMWDLLNVSQPIVKRYFIANIKIYYHHLHQNHFYVIKSCHHAQIVSVVCLCLLGYCRHYFTSRILLGTFVCFFYRVSCGNWFWWLKSDK